MDHEGVRRVTNDPQTPAAPPMFLTDADVERLSDLPRAIAAVRAAYRAPVDDGRNQALAKDVGDRLGRAEARDDVADVALLEPRQRQAQQVAVEVHDHLVR